MWTRLLGLLTVLLAGPLSMAFMDGFHFGRDWRTAPRHSTGIAPNPASTPEAVVQVYAARAFNWRGLFAVHTWIATKPANGGYFTVHQVIGWRAFRQLPVVVSRRDLPDRSWFGNDPLILLDIRGKPAEELIPQILGAVTRYPYRNIYRIWPGPNSNTFTAWVGRQVPGLRLQLPTTAIGKDYLGTDLFGSTPSGTGYQLSLLGILGVLAAREEGVEVNILGMNFGVDFLPPAVKVPGIGRIGWKQRP